MCNLVGDIDADKEKQLRTFRTRYLKKYANMAHITKNMTKFKRWTKEAYTCYTSGFDCDNCTIKNLYGISCHMKDSVNELIDAYGLPEDIKALEARWRNYEISL